MLALVQFMLILDVTVVNVALPNIQKDLKFGPTGLAWVVDGYVLMAGGLLLLGGRLSDWSGAAALSRRGRDLRHQLDHLRARPESGDARHEPVHPGHR